MIDAMTPPQGPLAIARLCALAGGEILVGERTRQLVQGREMAFEDLPPVRLKGKQQPVPLYRAL